MQVQNAMNLLIEQGFISNSRDTEAFDEFSLISNYETVQKVTNRNTENIAAENRRVEVFTHFHANDFSHANSRIIAGYVLCLPDSNAPVQ